VSTIHLVTAIRAPIERCFDLSRSIDLHVASTAHTGERAIAGKVRGLIDLDEEVTWRARHFGVVQDLTSRVTALTRPSHFRDEMVHGIFRSMVHDHGFEERGEVTVMTDTFAFACPLGPLGWIADKVAVRAHLAHLLAARNRVIKEACESDAWRAYVAA
jgi:ligand-binding SRPBCC domain-containing protein